MALQGSDVEGPMMAMDRQPFIGPQPFDRTHRDQFFGRTSETFDLASLVIAHPIVFLYGQSGTGKTSLLHAGLIPRLEGEEGFVVLPVVRPGNPADQIGAEQTANSPYVRATLRTWAANHGEASASRATNLADYLAALPPERDEDGDPRPRLLVFDQLEELFWDQGDVLPDQYAFFAQLGEVLHQARRTVGIRGEGAAGETVPTRVLLSMREEFIAQLDTFAALLPDRLRIRYRLERLREPAAREAVTGPLRATALAFAPGVAEQLVADLRKIRVEIGVGEDRRAVSVLGEFVEPVQLQVVCQRLISNLPPDAAEITLDHLSALGSVDATLVEFYKDAVAFAARQAGVPSNDLARWCEAHLVTETGTRAVVHRGPLQSAGMPNAAPDALVERFLLRREPRAGAEWYELAHDRLIEPLLAARAARERREAEEREAAEAGRRREAEQNVRLLARRMEHAPAPGLYVRAWRIFRADKGASTAAVVLLSIVLFVLNAGLVSAMTGFSITGFSAYENDLVEKLTPVMANGHVLGTDGNGRDVLTRLAYGGLTSLGIAVLAVVTAFFVGGTVGIASGYIGGMPDALLTRMSDVLLAIPGLALLILISTLYGPGPIGLALILGATGWVGAARAFRTATRNLRGRDFVEAARVSGASHRQVLLGHILPSLVPLLVISIALSLPGLLLLETGLSFLGVGVQPPTPSWGNMLAEGQEFLRTNFNLVFIPGLMIFITSLCLYLIGNGLREAFDAKGIS